MKFSFTSLILFFLIITPQFIRGTDHSGGYDFDEVHNEKDIPHKLTLNVLKTKAILGGWMQLDKNLFLGSPVPQKQHMIRRLRLYLTTTTRDILTLMFMVQGDRGNWDYYYVYGDSLFSKFTVRVGLCKKPFGLEALYSSRYLWMVNRSLGSINYLNLLDIGAVVFGFLFNDRIEYGFGFYNGNDRSLKNNPHKLFCSRVVWSPWAKCNKDHFLSQLHFGVSFSTCQRQVFLLNHSFITGAGTTFLSWNGTSTRSKTGKILFGSDVEWLYESLAVRSELIMVNWGKVTDPPVSKSFSGFSWYIESGYLLTGEKQPGNNPLFPSNDFNFCRGGGAVEISGRYEIFQADQSVIQAGLATGSTYVSSMTYAVNYYFIPFIMARFDWQLSHFHRSIQVKNKFIPRESVITCGLQGEF